MHPDDLPSLSSIGFELLDIAEQLEAPRLPVTTQLFPYLLLASRKMSTREMSSWLEKSRGVKLSAMAISKGLKRPDLHLKRIAEFVEFPAAFLCAVYNWNIEHLLFGEDPRTGKGGVHEMSEQIFNAPDEPSERINAALETLQEVWVQIPDEVKFMCRRYFDFASEATADEENQEM